jgi:chaperone BCS1
MALTPISLSNPVFQGGLGLMLLGGLMALARNIPVKLWHLITRGIWLECFIDGWDPAFYWVNQWLSAHPGVENANMLRVESRDYEDERGIRGIRRSVLVPGIGEHIITYEGARFWLSVTKEELPPKGGDNLPGGIDFMLKPFSLKIRCRSKHRKLLRKLLDEADVLSREIDPTRTRIYLPSYEHWMLRSVQRIRKADSVVLAGDTYRSLLTRLTQFEAAQTQYELRGIPYRFGCLIHGLPGNGKSSLVVSLAGALARDLYILSLGDQSMDDTRLQSLLASVPPKSVVLIEDIDTQFRGRERKAENKLTFSGLLNAIDGAMASEGRILFVTANEPEVLDAALTRPGRCDLHLQLKNACPEQAARLFRRFFPDTGNAAAFSKWAGNGNYSMATLQGHLLTNEHSVLAAMREPPTPKEPNV